jgi:hypothetical protein
MIGARFPHVAWFGQRPGFFSVVWPASAPADAEIFEVSEASPDTPSPGHARPLYFIAVAGGSAEAIAGVTPRLSVLADRDEWIYRDYESVTRAFVSAQKGESDRYGELVAAARNHAEALRQRDAAIAESHAERDRLAEEILRRASFRWWLKLPLRRLVNALKGRPAGS